MGVIKRRRIRQVLMYGWKDAGEISKYPDVNKSRLSIFLDILRCFRQYYLFSNQYKSNRVWGKNEDERFELGCTIGKSNKSRDEWHDDFYENRKFLNKYTSRRYENTPNLMQKRQEAYTKRYNLGENCTIQFNVEFSREHQLNGTLKVGNNVLFAKNVFIDYSGFLTIEDNVGFSNGVIVETHSHSGYAFRGKGKTLQTYLTICENVTIGSHAMICETCHKINRGARIGAGCIVRKDVPPYAIVIGNPAKIVGFTITPSELLDVEKNVPKEKRTSLEEFTKLYNTYLKSKIASIREYVNY